MSNMETLTSYIDAYDRALADLRMIVARSESAESLDHVRSGLTDCSLRMKEGSLEQAQQDIRGLLADLQDGLARVKRIVMDLRIYAREEYEELVSVCVEDILEQVLIVAQPQIKKTVEILRDYGKTPAIRCRALRIGQVFMNIFVNALHAVPPVGGRIVIRTYVNERMIFVEIADNGAGISEEHLSKIFEPFFTTKPAGQGTGLGLSISYEIIKKYGGDIRVVSAIGRGTTFMVLFPLSAEPTAGI
jgi:signal transduction histidine kinase